MSDPEKIVPLPHDEPVESKEPSVLQAVHIDPIIQARALRKFDYLVIPQIMIISIIGYIDRSNLGNARIFGFEEGAGLSGNDFNDVSTVFYARQVLRAIYIAFEIPWTVLLKRFGSNKILACLVAGWSLVTLCTGFVHTYGQTIAVRVLLGVFESGLSPCLAVTMSTIWDRDTIGWRISLLYVANALSGAFGGLIAYAIQSMGEQRGIEAWRWLFIIEGSISFVLGGISLFTLPKNAEDAWFLSAEEKEMMGNRKLLYAHYKGEDHWDVKYLKMAFTDPLIYLGVLCSLGASVGLFGYTTFLPTILSGLGFKGLSANYLTIPCYIFAAICCVAFTLVSDRLKRRGLIMVTTPIMAFIGYIIVLSVAGLAPGYVAMFLIAGGIYGYLSLCLTWITNNLAPDYKRAVGLPMFIGLGNIGGIVSSNLYPASDAPRYRMGLSTSLAFTILAWICAAGLWYCYSRRDRNKQKLLAEGKTDNGYEGDRGLDFRYLH